MNWHQLAGFHLFLAVALESIAQPFTCDSKMFFFQDTDGQSATADIQLAFVDDYWSPAPVWGVVCPFTTNYSKNALSANPQDGYLYFIANGRLIKLDASCDTTQLCTIVSSVFGTFDNKGRIWVVSGTQLSAHDPKTCATVKGPFTLAFSLTGMVDIAYNFEDCHLYFGSETAIIEVDTNGVVGNTYTPGFGIAGTYGGVAIGSDGNFYGMTNVLAVSDLVRFNLDSLRSDSIVGTATPGVNASGHGADMASFPCDYIQAEIGVSMHCDSFTAHFSDQSTGLVQSWLWDFGDGVTSTQKNPSHVYASPGTFAVTLVVTALGSACFTVAPDTTTISILFEEASLPDSVICTGDQVFVDVTDSAALAYLWQPSASVSRPDSSSTLLYPSVTTTYTVVTTFPRGCRYTDVPVIVRYPDLPHTSNDTSICPGETVQLFVSGLHNSWSPGATLDDSASAHPIASPITTTTYVATTYDDSVCGPHTSSVTVVILSPQAVDAGSDTTIEKGQSTQLHATATGLSYLWQPATGLSCIDCLDPTASPLETTTYYLTVTDVNGCVSVDSITVTVVKVDLHFIMPNAFSPNGDGHNDVIAPIVRGRFETIAFRIYSRWGELLFDATNVHVGWDGKYQNRDQPVGVYTYLVSGVDLDSGEKVVQSGSISLMR